MKILTGALSLILIVLISSCGPTIYQAVDAKQITLRHNSVAILPSRVTIAASKKIDADAIKQMESQNAYDFQNSIYKYLLKRKGQGKIFVDIQDVEQTNALLHKAGLYKDGETFVPTPEEIKKALNVDGYITSSFALSKPMSESGAIVLGLLTGVQASTNETKGSVSIHDCTRKELLWKYDHTFSGTAGSTPSGLVDGMMKSASKKMPYYVK